MDDIERNKRLEEIQQKAAELKKKVFEDECRRLDSETERDANERLQAFRTKFEEHIRQQVTYATEERKRAEENIQHRAQELTEQFDIEARKKIEARAREEKERKRKAEEEERRRREEEARVRAEEERQRREEEIRRLEEERKRRFEEERQRRENVRRQIEMERQRREEERQQQEKERQARIRMLLDNAQNLFSSGDYSVALVEVAKALVNDPNHPEALGLEAKIKEAQGKGTEPAPVGEIEETEPVEELQSVPPPVVQGRKPLERKKTRTPIIVAALIGVAILATVVVTQWRKTTFPKNATFAIVPWITSSDIPGNDFLGPALAGEVARRFEQFRPGITLGYSSVVSLWKKSPHPERAITDLGYPYVLRGMVNRSGEVVTVSVQIVDADEKVLSSSKFEHPIAQLPSLPDEITGVLVQTLNVSSENAKGPSRNTPPTYSYMTYLQAGELLYNPTAERVRTARSLLEKVIQQEPDFSDAMSALADVIVIEVEEGRDQSDGALQKASMLAKNAIFLDPSSSRAYYALGRAWSQQGEHSVAIAYLDSAENLAPNNGLISYAKAIVCLRAGRFSDAFDAFSKSYSLDARNPAMLQTLGIAYAFVRIPQKGLPYHELAIGIVDDSTDYVAGPFAASIIIDPNLRLKYSGRITSACERCLLREPKDYINAYRLARLKQVMGMEDADSILKALESRLQNEVRAYPQNSQAIVYLALTATRLGKFDEAINLVQRAISIAPRDARIHYKAAQVYALQMFSQKRKEFDVAKKKEALNHLKQALALHFDLEELIDPDYYNMIDQPEYRSAIQEPYR